MSSQPPLSSPPVAGAPADQPGPLDTSPLPDTPNAAVALDPIERAHLERAVVLALAAERAGNLPVGAVLARGATVVAEAGNTLLVPRYDPGGHAETTALRRVPEAVWTALGAPAATAPGAPAATAPGALTCYTTLEPCVMCMGALLLHGVRRVVFGAFDPAGGARFVLPHLPPYYTPGTLAWIGPALPEACDPLYHRTRARFETLPCGVR